MADDEEEDLDELLDEVEKRFCRNVSVTCSARVDPSEVGKCGKDSEGQRKHNRATTPDQPVSSVADDIDALLEELLEDDSSDSSQLKTQQFPKGTQVEKKLSSQSGGRKCCPVFVGGSSVTSGVGTPTSKRNNMPDREKLRARLKKRRGVRAFACQCSWFSTTEPTDLRDRAELRWVCGNHRD
ncbi:cilia- and flagella-associated protein 418 isoform X2 [Anarrhichthys ocellatus]|uniref:cilia- and flagella-associated protein 418 isoform X2 n=1 Tax=Anarrhichthys ocellatus TaxID=433405 RepID=UPI0012EED64D|nr:protein C8orf37 homolog isoform X2 [Anarrhichthys ocellatus]